MKKKNEMCSNCISAIKAKLINRILRMGVMIVLTIVVLLSSTSCDKKTVLSESECEQLYDRFCEVMNDDNAYTDRFVFQAADKSTVYVKNSAVRFEGDAERFDETISIMQEIKGYLLQKNLREQIKDNELSGIDAKSICKHITVYFKDDASKTPSGYSPKSINASFYYDKERKDAVKITFRYVSGDREEEAVFAFFAPDNWINSTDTDSFSSTSDVNR